MLANDCMNLVAGEPLSSVWGNVLTEPTHSVFRGKNPSSIAWDSERGQYLVGINSGVEAYSREMIPLGSRFADVPFTNSPYLVDLGDTVLAVEAAGVSELRLLDKRKDQLLREVQTDLIIGRIIPYGDDVLALCTTDENRLYITVFDKELNEQSRVSVDQDMINVPDTNVIPTTVLPSGELLLLSQRDACAQRFYRFDMKSGALSSVGRYPVKNLRAASIASHDSIVFTCGLHGLGIISDQAEFMQFVFMGGLWSGQLSVVDVEGEAYLFCCAYMNNRVFRWKINTRFESLSLISEGCDI